MKFKRKNIKLFFSKQSENIINTIVLISIFLFLITIFKPELILLKTTTSGGDTISHYNLAYYLKNYLLPHGKLIGWYPYWLAGVPMFQFYFVLPYLFMVLLSYIIPLEISFKLVTVLGTFLLPLTTFISLKLMKFKFPTPIIASIFSLFFLFLQTNSYYGGNIPSTLAGEFSYSISFALMILLIGTIYKGVSERKFVILNGILLALVVLTHIYTSIVLTGTMIFFLIFKKRKENLKYLFKIYLIAGLLVSFWLLPFILKLPYTFASKEIVGLPNLNLGYIEHFLIFYMLAVIGIILGVKNKEWRIIYISIPIIVASVFVYVTPYINLLFIRFLPFLYFFPFLLASYGLVKIIEMTKFNRKFIFLLLSLVILVVSLLWINQNIGYIPYWIKWNYEGIESKATYLELKEVFDYMSSLPEEGRILVEYSSSYDKFGSPRVFELSPVFTNRSVMEALLLESSSTFPFYYYIQKEVAKYSWWPGFPIEVPNFDLDKGAEHMKLYNVKYYIISSDFVKKEIRNYSQYSFLKTVGEFDFYKVNSNSKFVEVPKKEPILVITDDWKYFAFRWFESDNLDVPLVFTSNPDNYDLNLFKNIMINKSFDPQLEEYSYKIFNNSYVSLLKTSEMNRNCSVKETLKEEEILIDTNCIGKPLIIKVPYFPNWQVEGARKIYLTSPNLMMVFPESQNVRIYYGETFVDQLGKFMTLAGIVIVILLFIRKFHLQPKTQDFKK